MEENVSRRIRPKNEEADGQEKSENRVTWRRRDSKENEVVRLKSQDRETRSTQETDLKRVLAESTYRGRVVSPKSSLQWRKFFEEELLSKIVSACSYIV